ncbi:MAG: aspartate kinase [Oscillospiraceae bacterium]|nr:aspartate kinase [Oscillospiraceae bacterium]
MQTTVTKFGGTSLASAQQFKKVAEIIRSDNSRRFVVASAPGKRTSDDIKVTDMLISCSKVAAEGKDFTKELAMIRDRFVSIADELGISFDIDPELESIAAQLSAGASEDYVKSRGEYLNSKLLAEYLGFPFIDAADVIIFNENGTLNNEETYKKLPAVLKTCKNAVIPGFYGSKMDGSICTFSRGGSDVTGAIVAHAADAEIYENWTDVSGMLMADPRIVKDPAPIEFISYAELRELSYMGASVLHEEAVFPARTIGIPINIRNTNRPDDSGTMITKAVPPAAKKNPITGIAGSKGFCSVLIEQEMMNTEIGYAAHVLKIFADLGLSIEHMPSGIDTMSVVLKESDVLPVRDELLSRLEEELHPNTLTIESGISLIAVVGHGMSYKPGVAAKVFSSIANAGVNIRMLDQGSSELDIIIGVNDEDYEKAICAIYEEFRA